MDARFQYLYLVEVETQCSFGISAYRNLETRLKVYFNGPTADQSVNHRQEIFRTIHSFLNLSRNLSKLLWPGRPGPGPNDKKRKERMASRGLSLRKILDLPDQGHVLGSRNLRNYLEHFDEQLDAWAADKSGWGLVALDNLGPFGMIKAEGIKYIRCFNTMTYDLLFLDESVNLLELIGALENILPIVTRNKDAAVATARKASPLNRTPSQREGAPYKSRPAHGNVFLVC
jgi:hypothetical protein